MPDRAVVRATPEKIRVIAMSGTQNHAETDAGLDGGGRMKGGYLWKFSSHSRPFGRKSAIKDFQLSNKGERLFP